MQFNSVKALRRQLMAAVAMVLVAAVALGASTFAWFAANRTVTAEGMTVQAMAEGGIEIVADDRDSMSAIGLRDQLASTKMSNGTDSFDEKYGTSAKFEMDAMNLYPTSTNTTNFWYHAISDAANSSAAAKFNGVKYTGLRLSAGNAGSKLYNSTTSQATDQYYDPDGKQYFLLKRFNIRSTVDGNGVGVHDLRVTNVSVSDGSTTLKDFSKSLRVAIVAQPVAYTSTNETDLRMLIQNPAYVADTTNPSLVDKNARMIIVNPYAADTATAELISDSGVSSATGDPNSGPAKTVGDTIFYPILGSNANGTTQSKGSGTGFNSTVTGATLPAKTEAEFATTASNIIYAGDIPTKTYHASDKNQDKLGGVDVFVYVYFCGDDENVTTNKYYPGPSDAPAGGDIDNLTVTITFEAADGPAPAASTGG